MGQKQSFSDEVRLCLCNNQREKLSHLMSQPEFCSANLSLHVFAEVVERSWGNDVVAQFVKVGDDDQLATLVAVVIMHSYVFPLKDIFGAMKDASGTIKKHDLKPLFLAACDHGDLEAVKAMIACGCFDANDDRPVVTVFRRAAEKSAFDEELMEAVLDAHPGHQDAAQFVSESIIPDARNENTMNKLTALIKKYTH